MVDEGRVAAVALRISEIVDSDGEIVDDSIRLGDEFGRIKVVCQRGVDPLSDDGVTRSSSDTPKDRGKGLEG